MVTGEKNSPTAAHGGCKMQLRWMPGACGYSWVPGIINTVDWPSRLGVGQEADICHHKKLSVRKPKMCTFKSD